MTGFGRANYDKDGRSYVVDIKTVNNKYSDISVKMPRRISSVEEKVRKQISTKIARGKVDVAINFFDYSNKAKNIILNKEIAREYIKQLREIADENELSENISVVEIAKLPDILNSIDIDNDEEIVNDGLMYKSLVEYTNYALDKLNDKTIVDIMFKYKYIPFKERFSKEMQNIFKKPLNEITSENNKLYIDELKTMGKSVESDYDHIKIKMHNSILYLSHYVSDHAMYLMINSFYIKYCK